MLARTFLDPILGDDVLTRALGDAEARLLIEWLVEEAESLDGRLGDDDTRTAIAGLYRRGRVMSRFVRLWCHEGQRAAATQLAASEGLAEALPGAGLGPCRIMERLITHETARRAV